VNFPFFVARRYYFSKQSRSIINLITRVAVIGLMVSTAAMVIVLSAFNGIEAMVHDLYSDFDPEITVEPANAKTIDYSFIPVDQIQQVKGVAATSGVIEEIIIVKHENKWVNALLWGVDSSFFSTIALDDHIVQGDSIPFLQPGHAFIGAGLLNKLDGVIFSGNPSRVLVYAPSREAKITRASNPFRSQPFVLNASLNYNRELNAELLLVNRADAAELLRYGNDITRLAVHLDGSRSVKRVKQELMELLDADFTVKTHLEKNELIYKTSQIEKIIVFCILVFIFVLATFNMVASLTMLFIEKKPNVRTMQAFGLNVGDLTKVFFYQGLLITVSGIAGGLVLGYLVVSIQVFGEVLILPNSGGEAFPMVATVYDLIQILGATLLIGALSSYIPVRLLVKRFIQENKGTSPNSASI
jgi:lipoprotein-releasing system permease protein